MSEENKDKKIQDNIDTDIIDDNRELSKMEMLMENLSNNRKYQIITVIVLVVLLAVIIAATTLSFNNKNQLPGEENAEVTVEQNGSLDIRINEYVISNNNTFRDDAWNSPDWIELYNYGDEAQWLGGYYLSDEEDDPTKFQLPDVTLLPDEYILVLASGKTEVEDGYIRAPFQLSANDKSILLSTQRQIVSTMDIDELPTDVSAGYTDEGNIAYFAQPTPGSANDTPLSEEKEIEPKNNYAGLIIINEYLSDNNFNITDSDGDASDWIELYNPNDYAVFIGDMYLSDNENEPNKFKLPDIEIAANDYLLIFASGKISTSEESIHAPFKIGNDEYKIILSYKNGYIVDECDIYSLPSDVSAGIGQNDVFGFFTMPTPGAANTTDMSQTLEVAAQYDYAKDSKIVLNEWMSNNQFGILDANGDASDWIEIYNNSDESISLDGYALSDSVESLQKWIFPSGASIPAKGYLVVFASGKDGVISDEMHTNFSLDETETLYLVSSDSKIADSCQMEDLPGNVSKGRTESGYGYFALPTPWAANTSVYVDELKNNVDFLHTDVYISEVAAGKIHLSRSKGKFMYEYIEIYNSGNEIIDLTGYTIMEAEDAQYTLDNVSIKPNDYLLLSLKGYLIDGLDATRINGLSLNSAGETIVLKNPDGTTVDYFDTGYLLGDYSSGRVEGDADTRVFFTEKTPGEQNSTEIYYSYCAKPQFSEQGGMKEDEVYLTITADSDAIIHYTTNGGMPDEESKVYTDPIRIYKNTVIRAVAISPGKLTSMCMTRTFILDKTHDLPIICLSSAPAGLFYDNSGIYANGPGFGNGPYPYFGANYFLNVERETAFEYYESNGQIALAFDCGLQIAGGYSRAHDQKSLAIRLRDEYGVDEITYPLFDEGTSTFQHIFVRNGGQDGLITMMRDSFIQNCAMTLGTVDCKRGEPVVVYINGQYWGLYNLRDKLNADHFRIKYGYDDDVEINIITEYSAAKSGTDDDWLDLKYFCQSNDFSIDENYYKLAERVDVQSFMDYVIVQTFFGNADTHNINFWKAEVEGSKWRPIMYDLDLAIFDLGYSMVDDYLNGYLGYHDHILDALKQSDIFMDALLERYSYLACEVFTEEYLLAQIEEDYDTIKDEMVNHVQIYSSPSTYAKWESNVQKLRTYMVKRRNDVVDELQDYFGLTDEETAALFPYSLEER